MRRLPLLLLPLLGAGCGLFAAEETDTDPPPPPLNTRFVATGITQDCSWNGERWIGLDQLTITLEHADPLPDRAIPASGECVSTLSLFAAEALDGGQEMSGLSGQPGWSGPAGSGRLPTIVPGLWHQDVYKNQERCGQLVDHLGDGIELREAASFGGLKTPAPGAIETITVDGARFVDRVDPIERGDEMAFSWTTSGWQESFVQVRRSHDGQLREAVLCGTTGLDQFSVDKAVWDLTNAATLADEVQVYVGFQSTVEVETEDAEARAELTMRVAHALGL